MNKKIIWVVDDDPIYRIIISKIIIKSDLFSDYQSFINGKEALLTLMNSLENNNSIPDIILLDINMPIMDGWEFMEEMKRIKPVISKQINTYIVSSSIALADKKKSKTYSEILGYLAKPISGIDLLALV